MIALPINIEELLTGRVVEWERLEFKAGWNPEGFVRTVSAFANDIHNWGGGYLVIGVKETDGQPCFPPVGLPMHQIDAIQKEILELGNRIRPQYHPVVAPVQFQGQTLLVVWCPGGQTRPYQAPETLGKNASSYAYFIRRNSSTIKAQNSDLQRLYAMANQVPFDDRICHQAHLKDLDIGLIKDFLRVIGSKLLSEVDKISMVDLCRQMQIAQGPDEYLRPLNIGLMMFNNCPDKFFPYAQIDVVDFHDEIGDRFSEKIFKGPIHIQLKEALRYIDSTFIREEVRKRSGRAEADRFFNYPYEALEEALANAVYHKDYLQREPIEVAIRPDRIEILSFPGPMPPVKIEDLNTGICKIRTYRNRRIGDFLKELHFTEGRCTGIPKIRRAMEKNGSPPPQFESDANDKYFLTILPIHTEARRITKTSEAFETHQLGEKKHQLGDETHQLGDETYQLGDKTYQLEEKTYQLEDETHQLGEKKHQLGDETHQLGEKTHQLEEETHQLGEKTHQLEEETHQLGEKKHQLGDETYQPVDKAYQKNKNLKEMICDLCAAKALTAQEIATLLGRKDKKHLVSQYLTPLVKDGLLVYVYPERGNSPNQAYRSLRSLSTSMGGDKA